jgi:hypothetical protein
MCTSRNEYSYINVTLEVDKKRTKEEIFWRFVAISMVILGRFLLAQPS